MTAVRRYEASMYDSNRWDGFELRPGDIIISTPPKCGGRGRRSICALLILQEPEIPLPLDTLSPWIDMVTRARTDVFADLEAQTHRRFIKTHTPLDGIPTIRRSRTSASGGTRATWGCRWTAISATPTSARSSASANGRPRSTVSSSDRCGHRGRAPTASGTASGSGPTTETPSTQVGSSLRRTVEHLQTFRDAAGNLDVVYLHYDDLKADLEGQMRQMASRLGIDVGEHRWPRLVQAATFESMRSRAGTTVPGGGPEHWIDPAAFFSRGTSGQWRDLLDDAGLARYAARVRALASGNLVEWVHREPID